MDAYLKNGDLLKKYKLFPVYLSDEIHKLNLSDAEINNFYRDSVYLTNSGHNLWGEVIADKLKNLVPLNNNIDVACFFI